MNKTVASVSTPPAEVWLYVDLESSLEAALLAAIEAARRRQNQLLRLVAVSGFEEAAVVDSDIRARLRAILREELRDRLSDLARAAASTLGRDLVKTEFVEGEVGWYTLVGRAGALDPDLVVVATDPTVEEDPLGSTCRHLARKCPSPVWCVPREASTPVRRVLVAVDATLDETTANAAGRNLLLYVASLFGAEVELDVVHAWHVRSTPNMETHFGAGVTAPLIQAHRDDARAAVETLVDAALGGRARTVHCLQGDPGVVVPALARHREVDVVAIGNTARHSLPGLLIGRTAETLVGQIRCGVMVVKSPGFVSPVPPLPRRRWGAED